MGHNKGPVGPSGSGEVEQLTLVMFQDQPCSCKELVEYPICSLEHFAVSLNAWELRDDGAIIHIEIRVHENFATLIQNSFMTGTITSCQHVIYVVFLQSLCTLIIPVGL